jgi:hypothetical protein
MAGLGLVLLAFAGMRLLMGVARGPGQGAFVYVLITALISGAGGLYLLFKANAE